MKTFATLEGHKLLFGPVPEGVRFIVIPKGPVQADGILDIFGLGINFSNLLRTIAEIDMPGGFRGEDWDTSIRREAGQIRLKFAIKNNPSKTFETGLSQTDSQEIVSLLHRIVSGKENVFNTEIEDPLPGSPLVGRNDKCPCGSGKKFKKCCIHKVPELPEELQIFSSVDDHPTQDLLKHVRRDPSALGDPDFWLTLGASLGSSNNYELAILAMERGLKIQPNDHSALANYAATLGAVGRNEEALEILKKLPNASGEFSVLLGNVLVALDRPDAALPHYERSIEFDSKFAFAWIRLLGVLKDLQSSLYEYWVERARRAFPEHPTIAYEYALFLVKENRIEELAEAAWVEGLKFIPDPLVMGRGQEQTRHIVCVQTLHAIASAIANWDSDKLEIADKVLRSAPTSWNLCDPAHQLALTARVFGRRDLVWSASRRFCEGCQSGRLNRVALQGFLAQASTTAGDFEGALKDIEIGLRENSEDLALLNVQWWCLDEVGRPEEALPIALHCAEQRPDIPHIFYNTGFVAGKIGRIATARDCYEKEIVRSQNFLMSYENLALLHLLNGDDDSAQEVFNRWQALAEEHNVKDLISLKARKFEGLVEFVRDNRGDFALAAKVKSLNETSEPFFGAHTRIPERRPTRDELVAVLTKGTHHERLELTQHLDWERRGDHSVTITLLEKELPGLRAMSVEALRSIVEAQEQIDENARADFAPACMAFCKALEIILFQGVFVVFREDIKKSQNGPEVLAEAAEQSADWFSGFKRFVCKDAPLELGSMEFNLRNLTGSGPEKVRVLAVFKEWLLIRGFAWLLELDHLEQLKQLAKRYRNPAVHHSVCDITQVREAKNGVLRILRPLLAVLDDQDVSSGES
jgi:tetratricopeptide (TPR) repeat protein